MLPDRTDRITEIPPSGLDARIEGVWFSKLSVTCVLTELFSASVMVKVTSRGCVDGVDAVER